MTSSIGSISSGSSMQRPDPRDLFKKIDSDGSGDVSQTELQALADKLKETSGPALDASSESFASYDSDGSGTLSQDELNAVLDSGKPPMGMEGMAPPTPSGEQAAASYWDNSGDDELTSLISGLQNLLSQLQSSSSSASSGSTAGDNDPFGKVDTDGSGGVSLDELKTLAQSLNSMTGQSMAVDEDTFSGYDSDGDGSLSSDELKAFMDESGFAPPPPPGGMAMGPPPEAGKEQSSSASTNDSGTGTTSDLIAQLQTLLNQLSKSYGSPYQSETESLLSVTG